jgi:hypothetical protein
MIVRGLGFGGAAGRTPWVLLLVVAVFVVRTGIRQGLLRGADDNSRGRWRTALRVRFAIAGLILGGTWIWRTHAPLWERLLRLAVVMLVIVPAVRWLIRRRRGDKAAPHRPVRNWYWFGMKLGLIVVGSLAQLGLEAAMSRSTASWIVGAALAVTVALGGPSLTVWAARRRAASRLEVRPRDR